MYLSSKSFIHFIFLFRFFNKSSLPFCKGAKFEFQKVITFFCHLFVIFLNSTLTDSYLKYLFIFYIFKMSFNDLLNLYRITIIVTTSLTLFLMFPFIAKYIPRGFAFKIWCLIIVSDIFLVSSSKTLNRNFFNPYLIANYSTLFMYCLKIDSFPFLSNFFSYSWYF